MQYKDYYQTLGVARDATAEEIKKAYRKLARKYHPDVSREKDAELRMKEINEANTVLADAEKRAAYDQLGRGYRPGQDFRPPPNWETRFEFSRRGQASREGVDYSDFFSELFGGGSFGSAQGRQRSRGEDHHAKVVLDLEDAFRGVSRQITLRVPHNDAYGRPAFTPRTLNVKIPRGVKDGQVIRLAGQGTPGAAGGAAGDLLLEVHFRPHERIRVEGRDLYMTLPLTPWEAALGSVVNVDLPEGSVKLRIPEGSQSGRQMRLRGKGIPGEPAGDLLLNLLVVLPPADTEKARALYETMARELAFDPRGETTL